LALLYIEGLFKFILYQQLSTKSDQSPRVFPCQKRADVSNTPLMGRNNLSPSLI